MAMWYLNNGDRYGIKHDLNHKGIKSLVCNQMAVSTVHYIAQETEWSTQARCPVEWSPKATDCNAQGAKSLGGHTKFWLVDKTSFFVGSQNLYPNNLAEWGLIVDDASTAEAASKAFWEPLWNASSSYSPSGPDSNFTKCFASIEIP